MSLDTTLPALLAAGLAFKIDNTPGQSPPTFRATIGTMGINGEPNWTAENAALTSAADVDAMFKTQAPLLSPGIVIP